jgi:hypothetical protein
MQMYFDEQVPKTEEELSTKATILAHKPKFALLPRRGDVQEHVALSADAIVMPGADRPGGIRRVQGEDYEERQVTRIMAERRKQRKAGGRDVTAAEEELKGNEFYDGGKWWVVLDVGWMDKEGKSGKCVEAVVAWYYAKGCGVAEEAMYLIDGKVDDSSDASVLSFSLIPEVMGWVARSAEKTPAQIDAQIDYLSWSVARLKERYLSPFARALRS